MGWVCRPVLGVGRGLRVKCLLPRNQEVWYQQMPRLRRGWSPWILAGRLLLLTDLSLNEHL